MKKLKIAQIGTNTFSHSVEIFESIKRQSDIFEIVGYVLPEHEKERLPHKIQCFDGFRELTLSEVLDNPEIEAVMIETDERYLTNYAIMAAKAGKHIHMEKPGGTDPADFEELIHIMKHTGKVFHTGYMYRYNPYIKELINMVKNEELGDIISVEAQMNCIHPADTRQWLSELPGGMMFYLGCHLIDLVLQIKGKPQKIISFNKCSGIDGVTSKDFCMSVFVYPNAASFIKTTAVELGGFERRQLVVNGTKGTVELRPLEWYLPDLCNLQTHRTICSSSCWHENKELEISAPVNRYDSMMRAFATYVRGEKENPYTLEYELELYKTIIMACENQLHT